MEGSSTTVSEGDRTMSVMKEIEEIEGLMDRIFSV
jgi:hypothetical protein